MLFPNKPLAPVIKTLTYMNPQLKTMLSCVVTNRGGRAANWSVMVYNLAPSSLVQLIENH